MQNIFAQHKAFLRYIFIFWFLSIGFLIGCSGNHQPLQSSLAPISNIDHINTTQYDFIGYCLSDLKLYAYDPLQPELIEAAWCDLIRDNHFKARLKFKKILAHMPNDIQALLGLSWSYIQTEEQNQASSLLQKVIALDYDDHEIINRYKGWIALKDNKIARAEKYFIEALQHLSIFKYPIASAANGLGQIDLSRKNFNAAKKYFAVENDFNPWCYSCDHA
ncbi:MAG: hypothetical protein AAF403_01105, partial [Pseudomonadota bacterium]